VRDGETGFVIPPLDISAWTETIAKLLRDEKLRRSIGAAGRAAVENHYNWDRVARDTREFTLSVIGNRGKLR
jgi:glycosyltransferase involved in cell wall biosynthesis